MTGVIHPVNRSTRPTFPDPAAARSDPIVSRSLVALAVGVALILAAIILTPPA